MVIISTTVAGRFRMVNLMSDNEAELDAAASQINATRKITKKMPLYWLTPEQEKAALKLGFNRATPEELETIKLAFA